MSCFSCRLVAGWVGPLFEDRLLPGSTLPSRAPNLTASSGEALAARFGVTSAVFLRPMKVPSARSLWPRLGLLGFVKFCTTPPTTLESSACPVRLLCSAWLSLASGLRLFLLRLESREGVPSSSLSRPRLTDLFSRSGLELGSLEARLGYSTFSSGSLAAVSGLLRGSSGRVAL